MGLVGLGESCCWHSFILNVNVSFVSKVGVTGGLGGDCLATIIYLQRQCVIHFKSEGHRWAWGDCVVVSQLFSTPMCHSFQKRGSPVGGLLCACRQRLFGWLRFFKFNFSLIFNLFNYFAGFFNGVNTCFDY